MRMVKGDRKKVLYTTIDKDIAKSYSDGGIVLEFEVPESFLKDKALNIFGKKAFNKIDDLTDRDIFGGTAIFEKGLPKEYLIKVHK